MVPKKAFADPRYYRGIMMPYIGDSLESNLNSSSQPIYLESFHDGKRKHGFCYLCKSCGVGGRSPSPLEDCEDCDEIDCQ